MSKTQKNGEKEEILLDFIEVFVIGYGAVVNFGFTDFNDTVCDRVHEFLVVRRQEHATFVIA